MLNFKFCINIHLFTFLPHPPTPSPKGEGAYALPGFTLFLNGLT